LVWVRMGNSATPNQLVRIVFDNQAWAYLNGLMCNTTVAFEHTEDQFTPVFQLVDNNLVIDNPRQERWAVKVVDAFGRLVIDQQMERSSTLTLNHLVEGLYVISLQGSNRQQTMRWVKF